MSKRRLLAAALLALVLAPGTFVRTATPDRQPLALQVRAVDDLPRTAASNGFTRAGVWQLDSERIDFGGFSALLLVSGEETLRAFSDRGTTLTLPAPDGPQGQQPQFTFVSERGPLDQMVPDIEAAALDPHTGEYWLAFENTHSLIRYSSGGEYRASALPQAWQGWSQNGGAEAFARLPDGRFLVLPERSSTGLIYPGDPIDAAEPLSFGFAIPEGFRATDMVALPDGRVLVLLRKVAFSMPPFATAIAIADPNALQDGATLDLDILVHLDAIIPSENYEALAVTPVAGDGSVGLWLMSDDNLASFQRTLLVRLQWEGDSRLHKAHEKARGG